MLMFFTPFTRNGDWNDADGQPDACERGQAANKDLDCRFGQHGLFPLCQVTGPPAPAPAAPRVWGTGATSSFRVQVCVDRIDTLFFQDDRESPEYLASGLHSSQDASDIVADRPVAVLRRPVERAGRQPRLPRSIQGQGVRELSGMGHQRHGRVPAGRAV